MVRRRISDAISQHYCGVHRGQRGRLSRKVLHHRANLARAGHRRNRIPTLWKRRSRKGLLPSSDIHPVPLQGRLDVAQLHVGCISTDGGRRLYLHRQIKINISRSAVPEMIMCRPRDTPNAIVSFLLLGRALADALSFSFQNSVQSTPGPSTTQRPRTAGSLELTLFQSHGSYPHGDPQPAGAARARGLAASGAAQSNAGRDLRAPHSDGRAVDAALVAEDPAKRPDRPCAHAFPRRRLAPNGDFMEC